MKEIEDLSERVKQLEQMNRALTSQHLALFEVCRIMLPLIEHPREDLQRRLLSIYDACNDQMDRIGYDESFQTFVRGWFDELTRVILGEAEKRARNKLADE